MDNIGKIDRRGALECMIWAGTGVLWGLSGGVPKSLGSKMSCVSGGKTAVYVGARLSAAFCL